ncbi:MAG: adenylosuccinate lyase [Candidatus Omnitrophica bacterium]|nr:adenylosuccinate lyase [Candidatus Omnitrophota bacterium]
MISRYSLPEMSAIWSEENKFRVMLDVELAACEAMARLGRIPKLALRNITSKARFDIERIKEIEKATNHDVVAFIANLAENIGEDSKYVHMGLTSNDVLDTSLSVMMRQAVELLMEDNKRLLRALKKKARRYKTTPMVGRTHGMHAEPITFGLKMALFYDEFKRNANRLNRAAEIISVGKISGAVGTYANIEPSVEEFVSKKLGLKPARVSTQILQRDRHAEYAATLALIGCSIEKLATEIRHLQRTEVGEAQEYFSPTQKGSSAMPHKKNPITCERLCGLSRVLRGNAQAELESVALWHERDISHSSVERIIIPDSTILLDYMFNKMIELIDKLVVYPDKMLENIGKTRGIIFSQRVLLELINKGLRRQEAYDIVQRCAMGLKEDGPDFRQILLASGEVRKYLSADEIEACFDLRYHLKYVDRIFKKAGV